MEIKYSSKVNSWYLHVLEPLGLEHRHIDRNQLHVHGLYRLNDGTETCGANAERDGVSNLHPPTGCFIAERTSAVCRTKSDSGAGMLQSYRHVKTSLFVQIHEFQSVGLCVSGC